MRQEWCQALAQIDAFWNALRAKVLTPSVVDRPASRRARWSVQVGGDFYNGSLELQGGTYRSREGAGEPHTEDSRPYAGPGEFTGPLLPRRRSARLATTAINSLGSAGLERYI